MNCEREVYTNDLNLCKRCDKEVGLEFFQKLEAEEVLEEEKVNIEDLGLEKTEVEEEPTEEVKED